MTDLDKLIPALIKFQAIVKAPAKTKTNPHLQNRYADLSDIIDVIRDPLSQNGLAFSQLVNAGVLTTILMHESGQSLTAETSLMIDKQTMQGMGSAITYARRYALSAILGIAADDDDDGNGANRQQAAAKPPAQPITPPNTNKRSPASPATQNNPCTKLQQEQINKLWQDLGKTEAELIGWIKKAYNAETVKDLSGGNAALAVAKILSKIKENKNESKV